MAKASQKGPGTAKKQSPKPDGDGTKPAKTQRLAVADGTAVSPAASPKPERPAAEPKARQPEPKAQATPAAEREPFVGTQKPNMALEQLLAERKSRLNPLLPQNQPSRAASPQPPKPEKSPVAPPPEPIAGRAPRANTRAPRALLLGAFAIAVAGALWLGFANFAQAPKSGSEASASQPAAGAQTATPAATAPVSVAKSADNPLAQGLEQLGASKCIDRAKQLPEMIARSTEAVVLQRPVGDTDASLLTAILLPSAASKLKGVSIISMAPNQANGCGATYQSINIIDKPCEAAVKEVFGGNAAKPVGTNGFSIIPLGPTSRVLAMPGTASCVLVRQEYVP